MAMPKGWKEPEPATSKMPRVSFLSRPMVGLRNLSIHGYSIKAMHQIELDSGKRISNENLKYFEIQPIELSYQLIFAPNAKAPPQQTLSLRMEDIRDVNVSSFMRGTFSKKKDLIIEINSVRSVDRKEYSIKIDVDDKYADQIIREIKSLKQIETNATYWTHRSLIFTTPSGQKNKVDIYPLTPFLASGEEILWQSLKSDVKDKNRRIVWIDAVTNYRIFQYSYREHKGSYILFPSVDDIKISNEMRATGAGKYNTPSPYLTGIQPSGSVGISGDVIFYSKGSAWVTFYEVNDPETLSTVVKTLNNQHTNTYIGNGEVEEKTAPAPEIAVRPEGENQHSSLVCSKCGNNNPADSKFCNTCGSPLSPTCRNCGHPNPLGAVFCGHCGSKLAS